MMIMMITFSSLDVEVPSCSWTHIPHPFLPSLSGKPPEAGVLSRIYCENFMCHQKLSIDLGPHVNFITGQNGSGKSAILAALQVMACYIYTVPSQVSLRGVSGRASSDCSVGEIWV
jgi:hypothetical protein